MGSAFFNPIIIIPKGDTIKLVLDARYLNSITDLTTYSWPLEPLHTLLTRIKGPYYTSADMSSAYNQVALTPETLKLVNFVIGNIQYQFIKGFYGLAGLPNFFSRLMTIYFHNEIRNGNALTYLDDVLLQASTKQEMFAVLRRYHEILRKEN